MYNGEHNGRIREGNQGRTGNQEGTTICRESSAFGILLPVGECEQNLIKLENHNRSPTTKQWWPTQQKTNRDRRKAPKNSYNRIKLLKLNLGSKTNCLKSILTLPACKILKDFGAEAVRLACNRTRRQWIKKWNSGAWRISQVQRRRIKGKTKDCPVEKERIT